MKMRNGGITNWVLHSNASNHIHLNSCIFFLYHVLGKEDSVVFARNYLFRVRNGRDRDTLLCESSVVYTLVVGAKHS